MIVHLDTSALVDALTGPRRSLNVLIGLTDKGNRVMLSTIVLYNGCVARGRDTSSRRRKSYSPLRQRSPSVPRKRRRRPVSINR